RIELRTVHELELRGRGRSAAQCGRARHRPQGFEPLRATGRVRARGMQAVPVPDAEAMFVDVQHSVALADARRGTRPQSVRNERRDLLEQVFRLVAGL